MGEMQGRRREDGTDLTDTEPGDYWRDVTGAWRCSAPAPPGSAVWGNLANHDVTEHDDGTITVHPSILISTTEKGERVELFHGWLKDGVWFW